VGIPAEWLEAIFQPFAQVDFMRQRAQGGLGLGLPLIRHLVELHGGTVVAKSAGVGLGSEFTVSLPLAAAAGFDDFLVKPVDPEALARLLSADRGQRPRADGAHGAPPTTH
jgi:hypothetical protein